MKKLIKKLKKNYKKEKLIWITLGFVKDGPYWNQPWRKSGEAEAKLLKLKQLQQKNLSKRYDILESLELEIIKAKQDTRTKQRGINL
jgi:hypothetical protein